MVYFIIEIILLKIHYQNTINIEMKFETKLKSKFKNKIEV